MRRRIITLVATVGVLVAVLAVPASAAAPVRTLTISTPTFDGCVATATATWSGFTGAIRFVHISFRDADDQNHGSALGSPWTAGRSGTQTGSRTVTSLGSGTHTWTATATLNSRSRLLALVTSAPVEAPCELIEGSG